MSNWRDNYGLPFKTIPINKPNRIFWIRWLNNLIEEARVPMPYKDPVKRKAKHKIYSEKWYANNKELIANRNRERKKKYRADWLLYKASKSCTKCGLSHVATIDFHHVVRENKVAIPSLVKAGRYAAAIREAEEKCIPLCANCHRILHWEELNKLSKQEKADDRPTQSSG